MEINIEWRRGQYRILSGGAVRHYAADYGEIIGTKGADGDPIDVYRGLFSRAETVFVINQYHDNGAFDEHKIMLHFYDETHAKSAYELTCEKTVREIFACTPAQLDWWLQHGNHKKPVTANSFPFDSENPQMNLNHDWTNESQTAAELIYGWRKTDTYGELTQAATLDSVIFDELADGAEIQAAVFDALSVENKRLERTAQLLGNAFNRASGSLKVVENGIHISEPMRKNGTTNIAVMFEMTDGQTVSVLFHNPDTTPAKITPDDVMISWKWLLNRKDITIVVAKEDGKDLPLPVVARRVMALVEKNTARFAKANANKAAETELLAQLEAEKAVKLARLAELNALAEQRTNNNENDESENSGSLKNENQAMTNFSPNNPHKDSDVILAARWEKRANRLTDELQAYMIEQADKAGYNTIQYGGNESSVFMGHFSANKTVGDRKVYIIGEFKNASSDRAKHAPDDFKITFQKGDAKLKHSNPDNSDEMPKYTSDINQAIAWGDEWLNQDNSGSLKNGALNENEPIKLTGNEFGNFDAETPDGLKALRQAAKTFMMSLRGKWVHNTYLKRDIEIRKRGIRETFNYSANPIKLKLLAQIENIIATAKPVDGVQMEQPNYKKDTKPAAIRYFHLGNSAMVNGELVRFDVIIEEDSQGVLHYDLVLDGSRKEKAAMDNTDPSSITNTGTSDNPQQLETNDTEFDNPMQDDEFSQQTGLFDAVFDDANSSTGMVLNLFLLDENGNPLSDEPDNAHSDENLDEIQYNEELFHLKISKTKHKNFGRNDSPTWILQSNHLKNVYALIWKDLHDERGYVFQLNGNNDDFQAETLQDAVSFAESKIIDTVATEAPVKTETNLAPKMPSLAALGIGKRLNKRLYTMPDNQGWSNGDILDLSGINSDIQGALQQHENVVQKLRPEQIERVAGNPIVQLKIGQTFTYPVNSKHQYVELINQENQEVIYVAKQYFDYFVSKDKGATFFKAENSTGNTIVIVMNHSGTDKKGFIMPMKADAFQGIFAMKQAQTTSDSDNLNHQNSAKQQAIDYLNDIINGKIDGMADGVLERLFELIAPFENDDEINELAEKASAIIENAMPKNIE